MPESRDKISGPPPPPRTQEQILEDQQNRVMELEAVLRYVLDAIDSGSPWAIENASKHAKEVLDDEWESD